MYCLYCGAEIPEGATFCRHCGQQQHKGATASGAGEAGGLGGDLRPVDYVVISALVGLSILLVLILAVT